MENLPVKQEVEKSQMMAKYVSGLTSLFDSPSQTKFRTLCGILSVFENNYDRAVWEISSA
jgi:hypothetical protein